MDVAKSRTVAASYTCESALVGATTVPRQCTEFRAAALAYLRLLAGYSRWCASEDRNRARLLSAGQPTPSGEPYGCPVDIASDQALDRMELVFPRLGVHFRRPDVR